MNARTRVNGRLSAAFLAASLAGVLGLQAQAPSGREPDDSEEKSRLWHEVHQQLLVLPFYSVFDHITFTLKGEEVILTGHVLRPTLRADAEVVVKSLEGVAQVVNRIELLPTSPADDELRSAIYRAIYENAPLARYAAQAVPPIHIIVKNGNVTLEGTVDSPEDKNLASTRATGVANVLTFKNNLIVQTRASAGQ